MGLEVLQIERKVCCHPGLVREGVKGGCYKFLKIERFNIYFFKKVLILGVGVTVILVMIKGESQRLSYRV